MPLIKTVCIVLLFVAQYTFGQSTVTHYNESSCSDIAITFYNWYVPKVVKLDGSSLAPWQEAVKYRSSLFAPELLQLLKAESEAQSKTHDAGLDFDPFLNTQDSAGSYVVDKVSVQDDDCHAEVYGIYSGKKEKTPDVTPELMLRDGRWVFVNFHYRKSEYPVNDDLMSLLKFRQSSRDRHKQ